MRNVIDISKFIRKHKAKTQQYTYRLFRRSREGSWYLELYRGKKITLKTFDEREAKAIRAEIMAHIREGRLVELTKGEKITLAQYTEEYLAVAAEMVAQGYIRPNTARNDSCALKKLNDIVGAEKQLRHITRDTVRMFKIAYLAEHGQTERAMRGCNAYLRHLSTAFDYAMREKRSADGVVIKPAYISENPFVSEHGRRGERTMFKVTTRLPHPLMPEEIAAIRAAMLREFRRFMKMANDPAASTRDLEFARSCMEAVVDADRAFLFLIFTGMRLGEFIRFEERDVLFAMGAIKVRSAEVLGKGIKDFEERLIPIHPRLREMLLGMYPDELRQVGLARRVFKRWTHESSFSHRLKHFFKMAGVSKPPKATRHSFASYQIAGGTDIARLQKMMGHSDIATTQKYIGALQNLKEGTYGQEFVGRMEHACRLTKFAR